MSESAAKKAKVVRDALGETDSKGAFVRKDAAWRGWIKEGGEFPPEAGRYHIYISLACPWANGVYSMVKLKGLEDVIGISIVHPTWGKSRPDDDSDTHAGWRFKDPSDPPVQSREGHGSFDCEGCIPDPHYGVKFIRDLYDMAGDTDGKYTVPVLWDLKKKTIVSNESIEIFKMLNKEFNKLSKKPELDLYPDDLAKDIDAVLEWIYPYINNGVYRCGFAQTQDAYETAFQALFEHLDKAEELLSKQRYCAGDKFTIADIRLYMTLIRFDPVYVVYFKTNKKRIDEYPNLWGFVRELYQMPEIKAVTNIKHIKTHYFTSHPPLNKYAIIPKGDPNLFKNLEVPHGRDKQFA